MPRSPSFPENAVACLGPTGLERRRSFACWKEHSAPPAEKAPREPAEKTAHVKGIEDDLRRRLAVRVEIKVRAKDKGQLVIGFESNDDFERIVEALKK